MPDEQQTQTEDKREQEKSIEITDEMVSGFVKEVVNLEQDNLYVNRANLKEKILTLAKTKVR